MTIILSISIVFQKKIRSVLSRFPTTHVTVVVGHACDSPSTNDNKVEGREGKVIFPCKLCRGIHLTYHYPHMEASQLLEASVVSQQQPLVAS